MKVLTFFTIILILTINGAKFNHKFLKLHCNTSKVTVINEKCYIKSFDRRTPMANVEFLIIRPTPDLKMSLKMSYKPSTVGEFRTIIFIEKIEFCKIIQGASITPFLNSLMEYLRSLIDVSLLCNSTGQVNFNNWTFPDSPVVRLFSPGYYLNCVQFFDDVDSNIFNFTFWSFMNK